MKPKCIQCLVENSPDPTHRIKVIDCINCSDTPDTLNISVGQVDASKITVSTPFKNSSE